MQARARTPRLADQPPGDGETAWPARQRRRQEAPELRVPAAWLRAPHRREIAPGGRTAPQVPGYIFAEAWPQPGVGPEKEMAALNQD